MKKTITFLFTFFVLSIFCFFIPNISRAEGEFITDLDVTYQVDEGGITKVVNKIKLTNTFSNLYATSYSIVLESIKPQNVTAYAADGGQYNALLTESEGQSTISVSFPDQLVGKNKSREFFVTYNEISFAVRTGEVWEISIPKLSKDSTFGSYTARLQVPKSFGQEAYISPNPRQRSEDGSFLTYVFYKEDLEKTGVVAGFGEFQVFSFTLNYHLENPLAKSAKTEISFPPDTAYQKVYYEKISQVPNNIYADSDGNWLGEYQLKPRERLDVVLSGHVQVFSDFRPFIKPSQESLNLNLLKTKYWDISNSQILSLSKSLTTPKDIYDFVSTKLKYDYSRVRPNVERLGAVGALENPESAICMEFTDLFIALARAAGIASREVNGFAYTENPQIQPLSLVNDVLHAWPEYYDSQNGVWVPIDPTWGSTTGGVDYFNKLDLRHIAFVIHGKDDSYPYSAGSYKSGTNPEKDIFVSFGSLPKENISKVKINASLDGWIPLVSNKLNIEIVNSGHNAIYNIVPDISFDFQKQVTDISPITLLPFQTYKTYLEVPFSFLGSKTPNAVQIVFADENLTIPTDKDRVLIYNLLFIFIFALLLIITILIKLKRINLNKIFVWKFQKKHS